MANYDFGDTLSPIDFELLVKDILEAELGMQFENFKEGKDQGVDLRHAPARSPSHAKGGNHAGSTTLPAATIVQCKRYSQFSKLKSVLAKSELEKVKALNPARYILATSLPLSPQQANEIRDVMSPYIVTTADIYGRDRLNHLLSKFPEVERRNIKLWANSTGVLESILNARTHNVSREEIERTIAAARLYVRNGSFDKALEILDEHRVCIIAGDPGIGKTTLARMLLLHYYDQNFDVIKIESDISEARSIVHNDRPRFYYYDDFLGQTASLEKLNKNEDQKLLDFMASVSSSRDSVFVLTTRAYILNQAKIQYEKFAREDFNYRTCIVDLAIYSRRIRAEILYNHLYFSNLPDAFIAELVSKRAYIRIVDHRNYSPRLIQILTNRLWLGKTLPDKYLERFVHNLDNPSEIWKSAFESQLSDRARHLLLAMVTLPAEVEVSDLEKAFKAFHARQCAQFGVRQSALDFRFAIRELEGTFIQSRQLLDGTLFGFANPSIRDFLQVQISDEQVWMNIIRSAEYFEQAQWLVESLIDPFSRVSKVELEAHRFEIYDAVKRLFGSESCLVSAMGMPGSERIWRRRIQVESRLQAVLSPLEKSERREDTTWVDATLEEIAEGIANLGLSATGFVEFLVRAEENNTLSSDSELALLGAVKKRLIDNPDTLDEFEGIAAIREAFPSQFTEEELQEIRSGFNFVADNYLDECYSLSPEELRGEANRLSEIGDRLNVDTDYTQEKFKERAEEVEKERPNRGAQEPRKISLPVGNSCTDDDLDSMFSTLY